MKFCIGCQSDAPFSDFLVYSQRHPEGLESDYCSECRVACEVCGDYIGACGGCEPEPNDTPDNMYTLGLESRGAA